MDNQVNALIREVYEPVMPETRYRYDTTHAFNILHNFASYANEHHDRHASGNLKHYHYIPARLEEFIQVLQTVRQQFPQHTHFIDIGCGIGDKLLIAHRILHFEQVSGIEYDPNTYALAQQTVGHLADQLILGDANDLDVSPYDVIYMYRPIYLDPPMWDLFIHIAESMADGAIIVEMLPNYMYEHPVHIEALFDYNLDLRDVSHAIIQKRDGILHNAWNYGTGSAVIWHTRTWETEPDSEKDYWMNKARRELAR